nr:hypothetical protein [Bacilli bacterium]
ENVAAGVSVKVNAKAIGSATLVATSTVNPECTARVNITVIRAVAPLQSVWNKVIAYNNYTLDITRTPTNTEMSEHDAWTTDTAVPAAHVKTTEDSVIYEVAGDVAEDLSTTYAPAYKNTTTNNAILGMAIDSKGYAFNLEQDSTGAFVTAGEVVKTSIGLLNSTNFKGAGTKVTSINETGLFFGLQAVNPTWLTSTKASDNVYVLNGEDDDSANADFAEVILWQLVDYTSVMQAVQGGAKTASDLAALVEVTITCTSDSVAIAVDNGSVTYNVALTDVGTTAELTGLETFLSTAVATMPDLPNALNDAVEAINGSNHNYVVTYSGSRFGDKKSYFTADYVYYDTSEAYAKAYNDFIDANYPGVYDHISAGGFGIVKLADGLHEFSYTPATYEADGTTVKTEASVEVYSDNFANSDSSTNVYDIVVGGVTGYIENSAFMKGGYLYNLSTTATTVFTGMPDMYYVESEDVFQALYYWGNGETSDDTEDQHIAGVYVTYTKNDDDENVVDAVNLLAAWGGNSGFYVGQYKVSDFGNANENPVDALLKAKMAA